MLFWSKKDAWSFISTLILIILVWLPVVFYPEIFGYVYYILSSTITLLLLWFLLFTRYKLTDDKLICYIMFVKFEVNYDRITSITECKNSYLSYATSLKRLEISYSCYKSSKWTRFYISPSDMSVFLQQLKSKCKNLTDNKKENQNNETIEPKPLVTGRIEIDANKKDINQFIIPTEYNGSQPIISQIIKADEPIISAPEILIPKVVETKAIKSNNETNTKSCKEEPQILIPKIAASKTAKPKTDAVKAAKPKTIIPKVTASKTAKPKTNAVKAAKPKTIIPKVTASKTAKPKTDAVKVAKPKTIIPKVEETKPITKVKKEKVDVKKD